MRFSHTGPNDGFHRALRRQGWHLSGYKPVYADERVICPQPEGPWGDVAVAVASFYRAFGDNTVRKLVRAVMTGPRTEQELAEICGSADKLKDALTALQLWRILTNDNGTWVKGPACAAIDNTGPTLEWYVAEWFRRELDVPARHGVTLEEVQGGGDLDVVAFVSDIRVFVECKTGKPESLSETAVRWFLQRAYQFTPEIAVLLIDTESPLTRPVRLVTEVMSEMGWLSNHPEATEVPADIRQNANIAQVPFGYQELYHCARNVFLTGVPESIDASLSAVLRYYYSYVRFQVYLGVPQGWDFVERKILHTESNQ